jgi:hypothetical protein
MANLKINFLLGEIKRKKQVILMKSVITIKILLEEGKKFKIISPIDFSGPAPSNCLKRSLLKKADCLVKFISYLKYFIIGYKKDLLGGSKSSSDTGYYN